jgi:hypothetical protein
MRHAPDITDYVRGDLFAKQKVPIALAQKGREAILAPPGKEVRIHNPSFSLLHLGHHYIPGPTSYIYDANWGEAPASNRNLYRYIQQEL